MKVRLRNIRSPPPISVKLAEIAKSPTLTHPCAIARASPQAMPLTARTPGRIGHGQTSIWRHPTHTRRACACARGDFRTKASTPQLGCRRRRPPAPVSLPGALPALAPEHFAHAPTPPRPKPARTRRDTKRANGVSGNGNEEDVAEGRSCSKNENAGKWSHHVGRAAGRRAALQSSSGRRRVDEICSCRALHLRPLRTRQGERAALELCRARRRRKPGNFGVDHGEARDLFARHAKRAVGRAPSPGRLGVLMCSALWMVIPDTSCAASGHHGARCCRPLGMSGNCEQRAVDVQHIPSLREPARAFAPFLMI